MARLICPRCLEVTKSKVIDTQEVIDKELIPESFVYRRRRCISCSGTFGTREEVIGEPSLSNGLSVRPQGVSSPLDTKL